MRYKYIYAVFIESDIYDSERERLFYEGYYYEWFYNLKKAEKYAKKCQKEILDMVARGEAKFNKDSNISIDIERYDNFEDGEDVDYDTRCLIENYMIQGGY